MLGMIVEPWLSTGGYTSRAMVHYIEIELTAPERRA